jgi:hypothetical protein
MAHVAGFREIRKIQTAKKTLVAIAAGACPCSREPSVVSISQLRECHTLDVAQKKMIIPSFETKVMIYCNNNFDGNQTDFASKVALPRPKSGSAHVAWRRVGATVDKPRQTMIFNCPG